MHLHNITYFFLIGLGIIQSFVTLYQGHKRFFPIMLVLLLTFILEMAVEIAVAKNFNFLWSYHLYTGVEYSLFAWYLMQTPPLVRFSKYILVSIPIVVLVFLSISYTYYHFQDFPGINLNISGFLFFLMCTNLLFNLDEKDDTSVLKKPDVWIAFGLLIFYGGTFFYNGVYTKLLNMDQDKALFLFSLINKPLNIIFYLLINIGLLCLIQRKRFTIR